MHGNDHAAVQGENIMYHYWVPADERDRYMARKIVKVCFRGIIIVATPIPGGCLCSAFIVDSKRVAA